MFTHITVGANDIEASRKFYDAALGALGIEPGQPDDRGRYWWRTPRGAFAITKPLDGEPACHANGGTIGFTLDSADAVRGWQDAGVSHGGTAIEDPAGIRNMAGRQLFLAYLRDPDGNKLCAVHVMS